MSVQEQLKKREAGAVERQALTSRPHLLALSLLFLAVAAAYAPVLLHPHWGLFSDAGQILEECRKFFDANCTRLDILCDQYRPGFNVVDKVIWLFSPERPFGFYAVRWLLFEATVLLCYGNCFLLSRSPLFSFFCCLFWLTASATFEVIYTLDKAEIYIAFLFSAFLFVFLQVQQRLFLAAVDARELKRLRALATFFVAYAIFTKQTGMLAFGLTGVFAAAAFTGKGLLGVLKPLWWASVHSDVAKREADWAATVFKLAFYCVLSFVAFFLIAGGLLYKYGATHTSMRFLISQAMAYSAYVSELFGLLACCLVAIVALPAIRPAFVSRQPYSFLYAAGLVVAALAGCLALLSWVGNLSYIWFPLYALALPASCYFLTGFFERGALLRVSCLGAIALVLLSLVPGRILEGRLQFKMDDLANGLSERLANLASDHSGETVRVVMPFTDSARTEIGERIEALTLQRLIPHYRQRKPEEQTPIRFFNVFEYFAPAPVAATTALDHSIEHVDATKASGFKYGPGMNVYSFWSDSYLLKTRWMPTFHWYMDRLKCGDILVMPYGNIKPGASLYRGLALFMSDWREQMLFLPQMDVEPIFAVEKRITRYGQQPFTLGWVALKIKRLDPISWPISQDGWLMHGDWIACAPELAGRTLRIGTHQGFPKSLKVTAGNTVEAVVGTKNRGDMTSFAIAIPARKDGRSQLLFINSDDKTRGHDDPRPLMLHVDRESIE